jgi:hypothetical protein
VGASNVVYLIEVICLKLGLGFWFCLFIPEAWFPCAYRRFGRNSLIWLPEIAEDLHFKRTVLSLKV